MTRNQRTDSSQAAGAAAQKTLVTAMLEPAFYLDAAKEIHHRETHISHVFLVGDLVYKIKKPVRFPFLDFSTLAKRRHFLDAELRLNRRLAPAIYLTVVPIFRKGGSWSLEEGGKPAEYALLMRRLPENRMLDHLLETEQLTIPMMEQLADHLAGFHNTAERVATAPEQHREATLSAWVKNVSELVPLVSDGAARADLEAIAQTGQQFVQKNAEHIAKRAAAGWIRDVHGDLHAEHICFASEGIQIFDCIEFSDDLRRCDLASEIAFLLMDVSIRGGEKLVPSFLQRYLGQVGDADMARLLPFYQCHRALVRAKVHALRLERWTEDAARYFDYARRFQWQRFAPFLVLVSGFTGSGKSTLARALGARLGALVINSDEVRKRIAGSQQKAIVSLNQGIYSREMTEKTYHAMADEADRAIEQGQSVIADATFGWRDQRARFLRLAERRNVPLLVIRCMSSDAVTAERLSSRAAAGEDISDGRWEIFVAQKAAYEPIDEINAAVRFDLGTEAPIEELVARSEAFLRERLSSKTKADPSWLGSSG